MDKMRPGPRGGTLKSGNTGNKGGGRPPKASSIIDYEYLPRVLPRFRNIAEGKPGAPGEEAPCLSLQLQALRTIIDIERNPPPPPPKDPEVKPSVIFCQVAFRAVEKQGRKIDKETRIEIITEICNYYNAPFYEVLIKGYGPDPIAPYNDPKTPNPGVYTKPPSESESQSQSRSSPAPEPDEFNDRGLGKTYDFWMERSAR